MSSKKPTKLWCISALITSALASSPSLAKSEAEEAKEDYDECVLQRIELADDNTTIGDIKKYCESRSDLAIYRPSKELLFTEEENKTVAGEDGKVTEDAEKGSALLKKRLRMEYRVRDNRFAIIPHKPNYLLPVTFNHSPNEDSLETSGD